MKYVKPLAVGLIAAAGFAGGCQYRDSKAPHSAAEYWDGCASIVSEDPKGYQQMVNDIGEFCIAARVAANPGPTVTGCRDYQNLRLQLVSQPQGNLAILVDKSTGEAQPVRDIKGRMAVGTYDDLVEAVKYDSIERGKGLIDSIMKDIAQAGESAKQAIKSAYDSITGGPDGKKAAEKLQKNLEGQ